ncbi:MAG: hypothetical protein SFX73_06490 [Kofleriaceae bacterium]|nr:hypothetical protein [Kofleriaceae bacterium]
MFKPRAYVLVLGATLSACGDNSNPSEPTVTCSTSQIVCSDVCTDVLRDEDHCGACGTACDAGEQCTNGACVLACPAGLVACDGTCIDPNTDRLHCGATTCADDATDGAVCGAGFVCDGAGACALSCQAGLVACDGTCIDPTTDREFCGATTCADDATDGVTCDAGEVCNGAGACALSCQAGLVACDGTCIDPDTDRAFCGATTCADDATDGDVCADGYVCDGGACALSCEAGLLNCDGTCIDPGTDRLHCGATACGADATDGEVCADGFVCNTGACELSCQSGLIDCNGTCIDPDTDRAFCGATACGDDATDGEVCADGFICNGSGACELSCQAGLLDCEGTCIDPQTDRAHCGATACGDNATDGEVCGDGFVCNAGSCEATCLPGTASGSVTFAFTGAVETFHVPCLPQGTLHITAMGAQGGQNGGLGASIEGDFDIMPGTELSIVVGERGRTQVGGNAQNSDGGGGGTFVYAGSTLYVAAGGGGGRCNYASSGPLHLGAAGQAGTDGGASQDGNPGGVDGAPGNTGLWSGTPDAGGGAGWLASAATSYGGKSRLDGWSGGNGFCGGGGGGCGGLGGFGGGGGGGNHYGGGGGGGGYSGGGGGTDPTHGGGGGSFNGGTNQINTSGVRTGHGTVTISW